MEEVRGWLQSIGLDRYAAKFEDEGWDTLDILYHMKPDEIERCIDKPGHRRRFEIGLQETPPTTKASGSGRARTIDIDKKTKESLPDSKKSQELPKVAVAEVSTLSHVVTSTDTEDCLRATADRKQSKSLGDFAVQTQIAVKPILNETQSDRTEKLLDTQSVNVFQVPETNLFISNEDQFFEHIGTGKENARIVSKSDIRQLEREYESTQQTSYLDDKRIGRDADRYLQASCQVTAELSDITTLSKCVGVEADIGTFRADDELLAIVDTEKKYIELDNQDIRKIERNYESTHKTSDLDDEKEGREEDNKLQVSCQETFELSDIILISKCVVAEADIDTLRADDELLAIADTEKKYTQLDNPDIRQRERNYEITHKTSDFDDKREDREAGNNLQVSCQETSELSDITTLSSVEGAEADIDTFRADDESLAIVDTEKKYTEIENSDIRQKERTYESTHQTLDLDDEQEGREADNKLQVSCQETSELSDITTLSSVEGAEADIDTFRADDELLAIVDTENKYTEIKNSDIRQIERTYESTHQTSDLYDEQEGREADNKLQVSCQETSELSDITTLSSVEGAEADIDTFRADDELLAIVDTENKYTEIENSDIRQIERTYESTHQTSDLYDVQEGREADIKLQVETSELSDITTLSSVEGAEADIDTFRGNDELLAIVDTEKKYTEIENSDIKQIERKYESTHQTSDLDDEQEGREADNKLQVSCQETFELSDIIPISKCVVAEADIDTLRADDELLAIVDTEKKYTQLDNPDIRQRERNYESTHQTSDLDDEQEDREADNKLQVSCQETSELSDITTLSKFEGAEAAIGTSMADCELLAIVDTENKYTEIENSDIRQIERKFESTHQTSDLDDEQEGREADIKLQVSCQETSELSDITTLSKFEGAEAAIGTSMADCESLQTVDTFYVGGARNKIISTLLDGTQVDGRLCTRTYTGSSIAEGNLEHSSSELAGIVKVTDDQFSDSSSDDDSSALEECVIARRREGYELSSPMPVTRSTVVKDSKNVTIANKAEVYHVHPKEERESSNFEDQICSVAETYKQKDHLYVETKAFKELKEIIEDRHWALIAGKPGDGKTTMAAHLMLKYTKKGFKPVFVTSPQDWKILVEGGNKSKKEQRQFVIIDDMFGSMCVDQQKVSEWVSFIDFMNRVVDKRKGHLVVVCTSRKYIFNDVKTKIDKFSCFSNTSIVDMTSKELELTCSEKTYIWKKYTKEYSVESKTPSCIYQNVPSPHGFPHCVELYCSNQFLRNQGVDFFENPMKYICREIKNFLENDKIKYCILLLILLNNNHLREDILQQLCFSDPPKDVLKLFKVAGLSVDYAQSELKKALVSLKNTYISEHLDGAYCFSHESIKENVAFMLIQDNPLYAIEELEFSYLVNHTRCQDYKAGSDESVFVLPSFCTTALIDRVLKETFRGNSMSICTHDIWNDQFLIEKMIKSLLYRLAVDRGNPDLIKKIFFLSDQFQHVYSSLIPCLIKCQRDQAVLMILDNRKIMGFVDCNDLKKTLSLALVLASWYLPTSNIVTKLIELGANVNMTLTKSQLNFLLYPFHIVLGTFSLYNPLLCSVINRNVSLFMTLLHKGGSVYIQDVPVVLFIAVQNGAYAIVKELIKTKPMWQNLYIDTYQTELEQAEKDIWKSLNVWNHSLKINLQQLKSDCIVKPIHVVKDDKCLELLMQSGVNINQDVLLADGQRITHCIYRLLTYTERGIMLNLCKRGLKMDGSLSGKNCLHYLIEWMGLSYEESVDLVGYGLLQASAFGNMVNEKDHEGNSPFHYIFLHKPSSKNSAVLSYLMKCGANINLQNHDGMTPVMACLSYCNRFEIVKTCLQKRLPWLTDKRGRGYFHYLAESQITPDECSEVVKYLLESGEDLNLRDVEGNPPVFDCYESTFDSFVSAGAAVDALNEDGENILFYNMRRDRIDSTQIGLWESIIKEYDTISTTNLAGQTLLHTVVTQADIYTLVLFLSAFEDLGLNLNSTDQMGVTPLMLAVESSQYNAEEITYFLNDTCTHIDMNCTDANNLSVLHHCVGGTFCDEEKIEAIDLLMELSIDLINVGVDILLFAVNESQCGTEVILKLLDLDKKEDYDHMLLIQGIVESKRDHDLQVALLCDLVKKKKLSAEEVLTHKDVTRPTAIKVATLLQQDGMLEFHQLCLLKEDVSIVIGDLDDDTALALLHQIQQYEPLKMTLRDFSLHWKLCENGLIKAFSFIISLGIDINGEDLEGNTLLHKVVKHVEDDNLSKALIELLIPKLDVEKRNKKMKTPLHVACKQPCLKPQTIYSIITELKEVNQIDSDGMTALHYLCSNESAVNSTKQFDIMLYLAFCLVQKGATVDFQNTNGETCIMEAIHHQDINEDLLLYLIHNSKNRNVQDTDGNTVLHRILMEFVPDRLKASLVEFLLDNGGDINVLNNNGCSCLLLMQDNIVKGIVGLNFLTVCIKHGIFGNANDVLDIFFKHIREMKGESPSNLAVMKDAVYQRIIDVDYRNESSADTLLLVACECLLPNTVQTLLSLGADVNVLDMVGYSCFIRVLYSIKLARLSVLYACLSDGNVYGEALLQVSNNCWNVQDKAIFLQDHTHDTGYYLSIPKKDCFREILYLKNTGLKVLESLLCSNADLNKQDITGKSVLHHFVQSPVHDIFICPALQLLLQHGADVNARDYEGMTPLMACSQYSGPKFKRMAILLDAGAHVCDKDNFGCDAIDYGKMAYARMLSN